MNSVVRPDTQRLFQESLEHLSDDDDLTLPAPEGGWDDPEPGVGDASEADDTQDVQSEASQESLDVWIDAHRREDPDAQVETLLEAVQTTSLDFEIADRVYDILKTGRALPRDMRGVWTEQDDVALRGNDPTEIRRVEDKHGKEGMETRWSWLEA